MSNIETYPWMDAQQAPRRVTWSIAGGVCTVLVLAGLGLGVLYDAAVATPRANAEIDRVLNRTI